MPAAWAFPFARRSVTNTTIGGNSSMEERIALVGIIVEDPDSVAQLNAILH